jgi:hypothetical protein
MGQFQLIPFGLLKGSCLSVPITDKLLGVAVLLIMKPYICFLKYRVMKIINYF